jgi:hypothetical protein
MPRTALERLEDKYIPEPNSGCWLWVGPVDPSGYARFTMPKARVAEMAHRASWKLHRGDIPRGLICCHRCDTPTCVNPDHIFLGTYKENMRDASRKGRMNWRGEERALLRGAHHPSAKLSASEVIAIRKSPEMGVTLAREYGVTSTQISRIRRGISWAGEAP